MLPTTSRYRAFWPTDLQEVDRLFDSFFVRPGLERTAWSPRADLYETDEEFRVELDLPAFEAADVNLTVERGVLTIRGEREVEAESEESDYHVRERYVGNFTRRFSLPRNIDAEHVEAKLENGVLSVLLPKAAEAKPRQIEVSVK
jgi:HSP20 family protein